MEQCFDHFEAKRKEDEERDRKWAEEEKRREKARKVAEHHHTLEKIARKRALNLWKASEWWAIYRDLSSFIEECERRWHMDSPEGLPEEQSSWLHWARERLEDMSPFATGYPDPQLDGAFDATSIGMGDAYPKVRDMPNPPSMQTHETPSPSDAPYHTPPPKPYPFWLRNRRH